MPRTGSDTDIPRDEHSESFGRPVTESVTARARCDTNLPSEGHSEFFERPVTESVTAQAGSDTDFPNGKYSKCNDQPVNEGGDGTGRGHEKDTGNKCVSGDYRKFRTQNNRIRPNRSAGHTCIQCGMASGKDISWHTSARRNE